MADGASNTSITHEAEDGPEASGGDGHAGNQNGVQIDSSDEYDPAQDISLSDLPNPSNSDSHFASPNVNDSAVQTPNSVHSISGVDWEGSTPNVNGQPLNVDSTKPLESSSSTSHPMSARTRLPHDTIGILEDRIKDDAKGDTNAWLSLIDEYKKRGKIDEIRKVHERFFAVFPQAVSSLAYFCCRHLTMQRPSSGLRLRTPKTKWAIKLEWSRSSTKR